MPKRFKPQVTQSASNLSVMQLELTPRPTYNEAAVKYQIRIDEMRMLSNLTLDDMSSLGARAEQIVGEAMPAFYGKTATGYLAAHVRRGMVQIAPATLLERVLLPVQQSERD